MVQATTEKKMLNVQRQKTPQATHYLWEANSVLANYQKY
jgi:hypothetical protein